MNFLFSFAQDHMKDLKAKLASQSTVIGALKKELVHQNQKHRNQMEIEQETQNDLRSEIDKLEVKLDMKEKQLEQAKNATAVSRDLEWIKRCRTSLTVSMWKDKDTIGKLQTENLELKRQANADEVVIQNSRQLYASLVSEKTFLESENMSLKEELQLTQNVVEDSRILNEELTRSLSLCEGKKENEDMDGARVTEFQKVTEKVQELEKQLKEAREELEKYKQTNESMEEVEEQELEMMA